jgi:hypothetical protein
MRRKLNLILCAITFLLPNAIVAQKKFCPTAPPSPFKHSGQIVTSFDSAARGMRTTLEHPRPLGAGQGELYLSASFVHADPRRGAATSVEFVLVSSSRLERYRAAHQLVLLADGRPVPVTAGARYQARAVEGGLVLEAMRVSMSKEDLVRLSAARKVSGRVGGDQFELSNNHLEALRELASLMAGTAGGRWRTE